MDQFFIVLSHLYELEGEANQSVMIALRIMDVLWRMLSGKEQERVFQAAGNFLYLDLCDDCTKVGIYKISPGDAPKICAFCCIHVTPQYNV